MAEAATEEFPDYEEVEDEHQTDHHSGAVAAAATAAAAAGGDPKKGNYVAVHASSFQDFLLKSELMRAIKDCGFEHPSEVQHECIPQAILGVDILCQAKSGMGKTAVFVLAVLQQITVEEACPVLCLVLAHTRELAYQIKKEFDRFSKYIDGLRAGVVYGGVPIQNDRDMLLSDNTRPQVLIGTPGRVLALVRDGNPPPLNIEKLKYFVLDECDKMLEKLDMRQDVQSIFLKTAREKQVMMFSATMGGEMRATCKKFMQNPLEIFVDNESKLTLHGLLQYYVKLEENQKNRKLNDLLDALDFNQVIVFVKSVARAEALNKLLKECNFPSECIHGSLAQEERIRRYNGFKNMQARVLVSTDLFGRGIDIERINIVINYDMPEDSDTYLHRVGRAGRFGTKGMSITFCANDDDVNVLARIQKRFEVAISHLPDQIDPTAWSM
eukprot:GHVL01004682.1.p1 GENE.GHVL01004682.1~~GHVL01004682.1.p1  ORF type:complete len:440 (-),score=62.59 GHVL01004682.1:629-1948(-)